MSKLTASEIRIGDVVNVACGTNDEIRFEVTEITSAVSPSGRVVTTFYGTLFGVVTPTTFYGRGTFYGVTKNATYYGTRNVDATTSFSLLDGDTVELLAR